MSGDATETPSAATASTQQATQSTESASQSEEVADDKCWGQLIPCSPIMPRYKLYKTNKSYRIGRSPENDISISSRYISSKHCTIEWDGDCGPNSAVTVTDHSRYGTFVNGKKIEKSRILRDGNELALGTSKPQPKEGGIHDYRFIYRHMAYAPPSGGVHKFYDMLHELGKGSYATVMKALHKEEGKWYAIKIVSTHKLRGDWSDNAILDGKPKTEEAIRLLREITILQRLQHNNIVQLKEVFVHSRNIYLVLELVPGGDLVRHLLQKECQGRRLTESQAQHITYQICDALAYVHRQGIAHRDLKPENVLLTLDDPPIVKVADFGLAKVVDTFTFLNTICGTPIYLAPEVVLQGPEGYSQIVDSWSVGMITFIMLTMKWQPFLNEDPNADIKSRVQNRRLNWNLLRSSKTSEEGEDFIRRLLEDDPSRRMTLSDALHHPWLVELKPSTAGVTERPAFELPAEAATTLETSRPSPAHDDIPALDTRLASIHVDPPPRQRSCSTSSGRSDGPSPDSLKRRADVILHAREAGHPLPSPSQEMQDRVAADEEEDSLYAADALYTRGHKRKIADRSNSSLYSKEEPAVQPEARSSDPAPVASEGVSARHPEGGTTGRRSAARAPASKKVRSRRTPAVGDDLESDEVPGLFLRRSPRLNP
ncbi:kinase-like domain-containing protein [Trametes punicea]|nr:kinase-like domain-containing protein [Trametes punicea]